MRILESAALTDLGKRRKVNEDSILQLQEVNLFAVADGVGGEAAGEVASAVAVEVLTADAKMLHAQATRVEEASSRHNRMQLTRLLEASFLRAHHEVQSEAGSRGQTGMATTLVSALVAGENAYIAHVGDSRAYLLRGGRLRRLTEDHSLAMLRFRRGEISEDEVETSRERSMLYQAVGVGARLDVDTAEVALADGDVVMLCSDGLSNLVSEERIAVELAGRSLDDATRRLVDLANQAGGPDNISVVAFQVGTERDAQSVDELATLLQSVFLFKALSETERLILAPFLEQKRVQAGELLFQEGDPGSHFFIVIDGLMRISRGRTRLTDVGPGGVFGELALARPIPRSASVRAMVPSLLYQLSREDFHHILKQKPEMGARLCLSFVDNVGDRLRDLSDRLARIEQVASGERWHSSDAMDTIDTSEDT